jgi:hypothetical protein
MKIFNIKFEDDLWELIEQEADRLKIAKAQVLKRLVIRDLMKRKK